MDQSNRFPTAVTGCDSRLSDFEFSVRSFVSYFSNPRFAFRTQSRCSIALARNDGNLLRRQAVEFIDNIVDLAVERGVLAFIERLVALRARGAPIL